MNNANFLSNTLLSIAIFISITAAQSGKGKGNGNIEPYSITVEALCSAEKTDILIAADTGDPENFPLPAQFKKISVKIRNLEGEVAYNKNFKNINLENGMAAVSVTDIGPGQKVEVKAHIKTSKTVDQEVMSGTVIVSYRPDLEILQIIKPDDVVLNTNFSIEAIIREKMGQSGAVFNVSLYSENTILGSIPGVQISAGSQVSAVFEDIGVTEPGMKNFTIIIEDADPQELDLTNNEYNFSVNFINPVQTQAMNYFISYENSSIYTDHKRNGDCFSSQKINNEKSNSFDFNLYTFENVVPMDIIDNLAFSIESENGLFCEYSLTDLQFYESWNWDNDEEWRYKGYIPEKNIKWNIYIRTSAVMGDMLEIKLHQFASDMIYIYNLNNQEVSRQQTEHPDDWFSDASEFVTAKILLTDGDSSFGGGATLSLPAGSQYEWSWTAGPYFDWTHNCYFTGEYLEIYNFVSAWKVGTTNNEMLPKSTNDKMDFAELPESLILKNNYPNPFNPATTIEFSLPEKSFIKLKIYNQLGEEVAVLANRLFAGGNHQFVFDAAHLPSGVYYYNLTSGSFSETKKMIYLK